MLVSDLEVSLSLNFNQNLAIIIIFKEELEDDGFTCGMCVCVYYFLLNTQLKMDGETSSSSSVLWVEKNSKEIIFLRAWWINDAPRRRTSLVQRTFLSLSLFRGI